MSAGMRQLNGVNTQWHNRATVGSVAAPEWLQTTWLLSQFGRRPPSACTTRLSAGRRRRRDLNHGIEMETAMPLT